MTKNLKRSELDSSVITRGVESHGISAMAAWAISLQGRIQPSVLPKGQMVDAAYYAQQMSAGNFLPQITLAANGQQFVWLQHLARPHIAQSAFRRLNKNAKGHLNVWPRKSAGADTQYGVRSMEPDTGVCAAGQTNHPYGAKDQRDATRSRLSY